MSEDRRTILRRVRTFADLTDPECDVVLGVLRARRGNPGDTLMREGEAGASLMIVLEGQLVARAGDEEVARLGPGEVVGEMSFIDAEPRSATVSTEAGATVLEFDRRGLAVLAKQAPRTASAILRNVITDVARRLRDAGEPVGRGPEDGGPSSLRGRGLTVAQLRALPALASYADEDLELLTHIAQLRRFPAKAMVVREGDVGDSCFLLLGGEVGVSRSGTFVATLGAGALVGQLALLDRAPRAATVTARTETDALELRADAFSNLLRASSPMALRFQLQVALAGVRQLRIASARLAARASFVPGMRMLDDWDEGGQSSERLELDVEK